LVVLYGQLKWRVDVIK